MSRVFPDARSTTVSATRGSRSAALDSALLEKISIARVRNRISPFAMLQTHCRMPESQAEFGRGVWESTVIAQLRVIFSQICIKAIRILSSDTSKITRWSLSLVDSGIGSMTFTFSSRQRVVPAILYHFFRILVSVIS